MGTVIHHAVRSKQSWDRKSTRQFQSNERELGGLRGEVISGLNITNRLFCLYS